MTIVACVAANVLSIPPLFIIPGQQLNRTIMDQFYITGVTARYPLQHRHCGKIYQVEDYFSVSAVKFYSSYSALGHIGIQTVQYWIEAPNGEVHDQKSLHNIDEWV